MYAYRLILAASALVLAGCNTNSDSTLTAPAGVTAPPAPALQRIRGTVVLEHRFGAPSLQTELGLITMQGFVANAMASVDGADVEVYGTFDGASGLMVASFEVVGMHGRPALDGYLDVDENEIYSIRLANNEVVTVDNPPDAFRVYLGQRIWIVLATDDSPIEFGAITIPGSPF